MKEAYFVYNDEIVNTMKIPTGHKLYRVHYGTSKIEEVPMLYDKFRVDLDPEWEYIRALSELRAINKFKKIQERNNAAEPTNQ